MTQNTRTRMCRKMMIIILFCLLFYTVEATLHVPTAYTRPTGLQSVNGSDALGGCPQTPLNCVVSEGGIDVCRCPGGAPATGVLIDGVIPMINPTTENWASELFTVNRNGENSVVIGFLFSSPFTLREIEMKFFNCPVRSIAASRINVYGSLVFPTFIPSTAVGSVDVVTQACFSLSTVIIPVELTTSARSKYHIEMKFDAFPDVLWAPSIAEIRFSDETPTEPTEPTTLRATTTEATTVEATTTEATTAEATTAEVTTTEATTAEETTAEATTTEATTTEATTAEANTVEMTTMTEQPTNAATTETTIDTNNSSSTQQQTIERTLSIPPETGSSVTNTTSSQPIPPSRNMVTIIGILVAIIVLLMLFLIIGILVVLCFLVLRSKKRSRQEIYQLRNATLEQHPRERNVRYSTVKDTDTTVNQYYEDLKATGYSAISRNDDDDELYSIVRVERSGSRDGLNTVGNGWKQGIEFETEQTIRHNTPAPTFEREPDFLKPNKEGSSYAKVDKLPPPPVPQKTPELYQDLQIEKEGMTAASDPPFVVVSDYTDAGGEAGPRENDIYSEIGINSQLPNSPSGLILLSKSLCNVMDENPDYESSGSALFSAGMANHSGASNSQCSDEVYANPGTRFPKEELCETMYSESKQPSLFDHKTFDHYQPNEEIRPYTPIYAFSGLPALTDDMLPLRVTHNDILEIRDLGTGAFGNVLLAQTRGLSRKDLKLSETDDDKTVTLQVAIKTLKRNPTEEQKQAFEKEQAFMARLSHPNVIRMLAVCNGDDPFIMMEYMDNGDLNQYLQRFTSISGKSVHSDFEIEMNTLLYMVTQVASAMVYLTSKNYVHRDLATRNCLVGQQFLVKLGDFGMSRNLYESHYYIVHGRNILPIRWMATECFYGTFSSKSDVWAFGITIWEIFSLTKEQPYSEMGDYELTQDALKKEKRTLLEKPPNCPQEVYDIMRKCWASDPKERATFEELHEALNSLDFNKG